MAVDPHIDLGGLSRARDPVPVAAPRRPWWGRVFPWALLLGLAALLTWTGRDLFRSSVPVVAFQPVPAASGGAAVAGAPAFQAPGFVEPEPFPVPVHARTTGVVRELLVREGQPVAAGAVVARLEDAVRAVEVQAAEAGLARARAEADRARVELAAAQRSFDDGIETRTAAAVARAELSGRRAELAHRSAAIQAAEGRHLGAKAQQQSVAMLLGQGAASDVQVRQAQARVQELLGELGVLTADRELALAQVAAAEAVDQRASRELELRLQDRARLDGARAASAAADAGAAQAEAALAQARLMLSFTEVRAVTGGVVLQRLCAAGSLAGAEPGAAPLVTLFDPTRLRVRVDVQPGDLAKVAVGQEARIQTDARGARAYAGEVLRVVPLADPAKATVQVHVAVRDPDALLQPELVARVAFLSGSGAGSQPAATNLVVRIPARLVQDGQVWVFDPATGTATRRRVETGARTGESIDVHAGLDLTQKVLDPDSAALSQGLRVVVREVR